MKIPGLDDALRNLDRMQDEMIPLLERIEANTSRMTELLELYFETDGRNDA